MIRGLGMSRLALLLGALLGLLVLAQDSTAPSDADLRRAYAGPPAQWPRPWLDGDVVFIEFGAPPPLPVPAPDLARLGARLFRETALSADHTIACASCHDPASGFTIPQKVGHGVGGAAGRRNPPSLVTTARRATLDWDGATADLAARVLMPLTHPREMALPHAEDVAPRLTIAGYGADFAAVFGDATPRPDTLAAALVAYLLTLDTDTRFDRFLNGDGAALSDQELRGLHVFRTKARCANCHFGPLLTDEGFHNLRLSSFGEPAQDLGRINVSGKADDAGRFRTASLRAIGASAPYMHNGLFPTLEGVINLYDRGGGEVWARNRAEAERPLQREAARLSSHIRPLGLTGAEKAALAAFLRAL